MNKLTKQQKEKIIKMVSESDISPALTKKQINDFIKRNEKFLSKLDMFKITNHEKELVDSMADFSKLSFKTILARCLADSENFLGVKKDGLIVVKKYMEDAFEAGQRDKKITKKK